MVFRLQLEETKKAMETKINELQADMKPYEKKTPAEQTASEVVPPGHKGQGKVELDKIVVNPQEGTKGHVLSIDSDAQFVIFNLGAKQGVKVEDVLSVYRGDEYLGDVKATRVEDEMAAADIIPPLSSSFVALLVIGFMAVMIASSFVHGINLPNAPSYQILQSDMV